MSLKKETVKLSLITGIGIGGGLVFHILLGRKFGVSWQLDCLFVVLALFGWLGLFNTFFTSLYIPIFNEVKKNSMKESLALADVVIKWVFLISVFIVFFVLIFDELIIKILAPGFAQYGIALSKEINRIIIFGLIFHSISYPIVLTLNALYYYFIPSLTSLLNPLFNISALFILTPIFGIKAIAISYLLSNFFKTCILLLYLYFKTGWKPTLRFYHEKLPELINKSSKMAVNGFVWSLKDIVIRNIASRLGEGAVTLFSYAEKIINILVQVMIAPLARVFYARISEWRSLSQWKDIKLLFMRTARISLSLGLFIAAGAVIFLPALLNIFFYGSKFTAEDITVLSLIINIMVVYFIILSLETYFSRIVFATKRVGVVAIIVTLGIVVLSISALSLSRHYGIYGLASGITFTQLVICSLYYIYTRKLLELRLLKLLSKFFNAFCVTFVFFFLGLILKNVITNNLIVIFVMLPVWLLLYVLAAKIFLKEEMEILLSK